MTSPDVLLFLNVPSFHRPKPRPSTREKEYPYETNRSDNTRLGLVPRELVSWESEDPGIVSVEGGVLTAKGVGTTTIRATYNDRQVSCAASCLAQTQEELTKLANVRIQSKLDETESYAPDQYLIVQKAQVLTHGRYLALFISPDVDAMKAGFEAAFK